MPLFNPLNHVKNLRRLGAKGLQSSQTPTSTTLTQELIHPQPDIPHSWRNWSTWFCYYFKQLFGVRTLKTGLAVFFALMLSQLPFVSNPFYVTMGTVFALQSTVKNSFVVGQERLLGTFIGGALGFLFACLPWDSFLLIAFAAILTIVFCNQTGNTKAITLSLTICLSILISIEDQYPLAYSFFRMTDTALGLMVGILVNYFIARPDYEKPLIQLFQHVLEQALHYYTSLLTDTPFDPSPFHQSRSLMEDLAKKYLEDTVKPTLESTVIVQLLEDIHDLRFHLKGLRLLLAEKHLIDPQDSDTILSAIQIRQTSETPFTNLTLQSESLVRYHLEKINGYIQRIQQQLNNLMQS